MLAQFCEDHFDLLGSWFENEREVALWSGPRASYPLDAAQMREMLDETRSIPATRHAWMVLVADEIFGHAQLAIDSRAGSATLQRVAIAPAYRGRGLAGPMVRKIVEQAFGIPIVERLDLMVYPFNTPALKTYQKLGFQHEGTLRSSMPVGLQRWDTMVMSMLRTEFRSV